MPGMGAASTRLEVEHMEEALDALLTRVRWYTVRRLVIPLRVARAFNAFADQCDKPNTVPWERIP